jgi:Na+:H+ antiporter, NhaA family
MNFIEEFIKKESSAGIVLIFITIAALAVANSPLVDIYNNILHTPLSFDLGPLSIHTSFVHAINDGLMTIFFLLIGLEVKRELLEGDLSSPAQCVLPGVAALGGMIAPAAVFLLFNYGDPDAFKGWAIPMATDIAFALGILSLFGKRVPVSLKIFLMALAILDDLGAILIIAIFYSDGLSFLALGIASLAFIGLIILNILGVVKKTAYALIGIILWVAILKSGIHATIAGVLLAFTIPLTAKDKKGKPVSVSKEMEHNLHYWVAFFIIPIFAFANAGLTLNLQDFSNLIEPMPLGIILGLFIGKQIGVFGFSYIAIKLKLASLPKNSDWKQFYGVALLTGIGFTMSIFIALLSYSPELYHSLDLLAILVGSLLSGVAGFAVLALSLKKINR